MIETLLFYKIALLSVIASAGVVFAPNIVYAAISLLVVFACVAGFFLLNNADFLAIAQVLVYAVGLTIIILFGLMFTGGQTFAPVVGQRVRQWTAVVIALVAATVMAVAAVQMAGQFNLRAPSADLVAQYQQVGSIKLIGQLLYSKYLLPFELASILLLGAMVGAIVISKKHFGLEEATGSIKFDTNRGGTPIGAQQWRQEFATLDSREAAPPQPTLPAASSDSQIPSDQAEPPSPIAVLAGGPHA